MSGMAYADTLLSSRILIMGKDFAANNSINFDWVRFWTTGSPIPPPPPAPPPPPPAPPPPPPAPPPPAPPSPPPSPAPTAPLGIYVLAGVVPSAILAAPVYAKVIEATSDGAGTFLTPSVVSSMKAPNTIVLGYLDCGFCESFRPYYATAKAAGILINPNSPVFGIRNSAEYPEFWTPTWLSICQNRISSLISAGFDGCYLDVIDGWNYSGTNNDPVVVAAGGLSNSANYMTQFIANLRTYAQGIKSSFLIWVNGAEELFNPSLAGYNLPQ